MSYVFVGVGRPGIRTILRFYQILAEYYKVDQNGQFLCSNKEQNIQNKTISKFFQEREVGKSGKKIYLPQAILIDNDYASQCQIVNSKLGKLYTQEKILIWNLEQMNGICRFLYDKDYTQDFIAEKSRLDEITGIANSIIFSLSPIGAFGSSFARWLKSDEDIRNYYMRETTMTFINMPNFEQDTVSPIQLYNTLISYDSSATTINYMYTNTNIQSMLNHTSIEPLKSKFGVNPENKFSLVDLTVGLIIYDFTAPFRNTCLNNQSLKKIEMNLIPFPRINITMGKYFVSDIQPSWTDIQIKSSSQAQSEIGWEDQIFSNCIKKENSTGNHDIINQPHVYGSFIQINGSLNRHQFGEIVYTHRKANENKIFKQWIPDSSYYNYIENDDLLTSSDKHILGSGGIRGLLVGISTQNKQFYEQVSERFTAFYRRKAFFHHYTSIGYDEMEFVEAESNYNDYSSQYIEYTNYIAEQDEEFQEEDQNF